MKKIGIIGGLGPESTLEYYSGIIKAFRDSYEKTGFPEIVLESLNLKECLGYASSNEWAKLTMVISEACKRLQQSGADFAAIASNTPHKIFADLLSFTDLPLVSIVEVTKEYARLQELKKLILLGTQFTMSSSFYSDVFSDAGMELFTPETKEQEIIQDKIFSELQFGIIKQETKSKLIEIINQLKNITKSTGVILACTELPLILKPADFDLHYVNPTQIHIDAIVKECGEK